jgi:hypothetical protein
MKEQISKKPSGRPSRKSVGVRDKLLIINKDPTREYRVVSSDPRRIYELTTDNSIPVGGGQSHVLMSIDKEWYHEGQKEKEEQNQALEAGLSPKLSDGQYGKITIGSTTKEPT